MIPHNVVKEYEHSPWVVIHPDLHHANIIIDDEFNIRGLAILFIATHDITY